MEGDTSEAEEPKQAIQGNKLFYVSLQSDDFQAFSWSLSVEAQQVVHPHLQKSSEGDLTVDAVLLAFQLAAPRRSHYESLRWTVKVSRSCHCCQNLQLGSRLVHPMYVEAVRWASAHVQS